MHASLPARGYDAGHGVSDVVIIDSGGANLASLGFALHRLGAQARVTSDQERIRAAKRVILPGVGSAGDAMARLRRAGLDTLIPTLTQPVLGICLGMQLLCAHSEENDSACLGIVPVTVRKLVPVPGLPVPHMGWNQLEPAATDPLLENLGRDDHVYFVHSYAAPVNPATIATAQYGEPVTAVLRIRNFWGTQFHPERSAKAGARLLDNFMKVC